MNKQFDEKVTAFLESNKEHMFADVDRMLRIDSVKGEPEPGMAVGPAVNEALDTMLSICAAHGMKTRNLDGIVGEAVYGDGKESLGIIFHVDIVPTGSGWTKPPLALTREGGMLYGRGVADDKGPGVASLWALLAALNAGAVLNKKIVFIVGGNEESGMACIRRYLETEPAPDTAFTPDADFPAIYYEKTIVRGELKAVLPQGSVLKALRGGSRPNVVPDGAEALLAEKPQGALPAGVTLEKMSEGWLLKAAGRAAHASMPEKGDNAIIRLLSALEALLPKGDAALPAVAGLRKLCADNGGRAMGINCADEDGGPLTFNLGVVSTVGRNLVAVYDIRHPASIDEQEHVHQRIPEAAAKMGWEAYGAVVDKGFRLGKDHPLIQTLMRVYNDVCGGDEQPLAIGGGTYARSLPCAAAFGILFEDDPQTIHMADECIPEATFMKAARIYAHAIAELGK